MRPSITEWMDRTFYPGEGDHWDDKRFRDVLNEWIKPHHRVLDYGAGRGAVEALSLRGRVRSTCGVDPDAAVLNNSFLDDARLLDLASGKIPFDDGSFDLVFSSNVLEHVTEPETAFLEIFRVLKRGGVCVVKTPNKYHYVPTLARITPHAFHVRVNRWRGRDPRDTFPTVYGCNTRRALRRYARLAGFEIVRNETWEGRPEYLRFVAPLYLVGILYERLVNASPLFSAFRCVLVGVFRRPEDV